MATFITTMHFTEQGIKAVRDTCDREAAFKATAKKLAKLLRPFPAEGMLAYRVSTLVNNAKNDVPQCVEAIR